MGQNKYTGNRDGLCIDAITEASVNGHQSWVAAKLVTLCVAVILAGLCLYGIYLYMDQTVDMYCKPGLLLSSVIVKCSMIADIKI